MEVNVSHKRYFGNALANLFQCESGVVVGHGETNDLASRAHHFFYLRHSGTNVGCVSLRHRLNHYGSAATDLEVSYLNWF
jgi:predicted acetyltransferase